MGDIELPKNFLNKKKKKLLWAVISRSLFSHVRAVRYKSGAEPAHTILTGLFASIPQPIICHNSIQLY
jgi:hypothetical protein